MPKDGDTRAARPGPPLDQGRRTHATILLIEDNAGDAGLMREALRHGAVEVTLHIASDGEQALRWLRAGGAPAEGLPRDRRLDLAGDRPVASTRSGPATGPKSSPGDEDAPLQPDLVILDLNLPGTGGHDVLAAIREDPALAKLPVLVLSSSEAPRDVALAYALHANSYHVKPSDFRELEALVASIEAYWFQHAVLPSDAAAGIEADTEGAALGPSTTRAEAEAPQRA